AAVILDPKLEQSGYPFQDISGAAVAFKLVSALRFSRNEPFYGQEFCLMDVRQEEGGCRIDCLKTRNLVRTDFLSLKAAPGGISISDTRLPEFLKGQAILVWNEPRVARLLQGLFGTGVEFQMKDMQPEIARMIPHVGASELGKIRTLSKIARYSDGPVSEIEGFFTLFVTFAKRTAAAAFPKHEEDAVQDLQLVALAALADVMPMRNENRIFVRNGIAAMNGGRTRKGLAELLARTELAGRQLASADLSWKVIPALNAAGRMGRPNLSLELLVSDDPAERLRLAETIIGLNEERKALVSDGEMRTSAQAAESFERLGGKLSIVVDAGVNRGVTGILASRIMQKYAAPAIAITFSEDGETAIGSMRSCRGCVATDFLGTFGDFFINHGGHDSAAGFSFEKRRLPAFLEKAAAAAAELRLCDEADGIDIDAELPPEFITPKLLQLVEKFEPFGEENRELVFLSKSLKIQDALIVGRSERQHLKLHFDCKKHKVPAMFWGEAERLNRDFRDGDSLDVIYKIGRNTFNGMTSLQMILIDAEHCPAP
ncbi:MAG: DHH family phosphoesterase, partial [Treponemataceae bacterium]|nr:DHH family phosphoesterase [Treponemataceae bacterium]